MKFDYDSMPTLMLLAAGLFVMFASPPVVDYDEVESAGKRLGNENNDLYGNAYVLGSDESVDIVMQAIAAYNEGDAEKEGSFYTKDMQEQGGDFSREWHSKTKSLNQQPWAVIPVRLEGDDDDLVLVWSVEDRVWENGSTQTLDLMEVFPVNDEGKISGFSQWKRERADNQFSDSSGGKFIGLGDSEWSGRPLVFSNRGEVEVIEQLAESWNSLDIDGWLKFYADEVTSTDYEGERVTLKKDDMRDYLESYTKDIESVDWKIRWIAPLKIYDTDPESGVTVFSREKRVMKDGSVWEKNLVEWYYFDLDGKISGFSQFAQDIQNDDSDDDSDD